MNHIDQTCKIAADGKREATRGCEIAEKARVDLLTKPYRWQSEPIGLDSAQILAGLVRSQKPIRAGLVEQALSCVRQNRRHAAGMAFAQLQRSFGNDAEWIGFAKKSFPEFRIESIERLISDVLRRGGGPIRCTKCGEECEPRCICGTPYTWDASVAAMLVEPIKGQTALERATAAIAADPTKSNRLVAKEIGVGEWTVRQARKDHAVDHAVDARTGADGRRRRLPTTSDDESDSPKSQHLAYMLRADAARSFATYHKGPIDEDAIDIARDTAATWAALVEELKQQQAKRRKR